MQSCTLHYGEEELVVMADLNGWRHDGDCVDREWMPSVYNCNWN